MLDRPDLTEPIVRLAIAVHRQLGPGLLESVYRNCLSHELREAGIPYRSEVPVPLVYKSVHLDTGFRADILVGQDVIVEIKAVEALAPVHEAQILTYLRLTGYPIGLLINFNVVRLKDGLRRYVNSSSRLSAPPSVSSA